MGARRLARECALMILYQIDIGAQPIDSAIERFWASYASGEPLEPAALFSGGVAGDDLGVLDAEVKDYAELLVRGVMADREALDAGIQKVSQNWRLERMACVDRNLLRLSALELTTRGEEVPRKVAINEAVEIAKKYGSAESSAFINGILDRIGK